MATIGGPNTVKDDLVFGYDTGYGVADNNTATRFYPGRPTTNYGPSSLGEWGTENTAQRIATGNTYKGQPTYNCRTTVGASWQGIDKTISGLRTAAGSSGTVTMSCYIKNNNNTSYPCYAYIGHDFSSTRNIAANSDWQRIQWTINQSSMNNDYVELRPYTNNASTYMEMTMPMVEVNVTTATPFLIGTRSSTQSLIDLKRTKDINVSNVSFDSTGQPVFDGTDDGVSLGTNFNLNNRSFSVESIIKWDGGSQDTFFSYKDSAGGTQKDIHWRIYTSGQLRFDFYSNSINSSVGSIVAGEYVHLVTTYNFGSDSCICYKNGEVLMAGSAGPFLGNDTNSTAYVGAWGTTQRFGGEIPILKMYTSAMSASEIKQNYNAYKNRFNI